MRAAIAENLKGEEITGVGDDAVPMAEVVMASPTLKSQDHQYKRKLPKAFASSDAVKKSTAVRDDGFNPPADIRNCPILHSA